MTISQKTIRTLGFGMGIGALPVWWLGSDGFAVVVSVQLFLLLVYVAIGLYGGVSVAS